MRMSDAIDQIAEALSAAQGQIEAASKAVSNTFFKSKYADLNALRDVSRSPPMACRWCRARDTCPRPDRSASRRC